MIKRQILFLFLLLLEMSISAQNIMLKGSVESKSGEKIPGASIFAKDIQKGTMTDEEGAFTIQCNSKTVLQISCIGYKTRQVPVNGKSSLKIILEEDSHDLEEVVVVGYGVMRKSDLTGAVTSVKAEEALKQMPVSNITDALQGRLSGVSIVSASGQPGSEATIRVRGVNSIQADTGPLVVIDGFIGGSLSSLNPADIESIEVLKDASATAIYGSQGANGVILVTTKNAEKGKIKLQYNGYVNFKTPYSLPDMMTPGEFARLANDYGKEFYTASGVEVREFYNVDEIAAFDNGSAGYDYIDNIFRKCGIEHIHEVSVSGGENKTQYLISGRYSSNEGIVETSFNKKVNYRVKIDSDIRPWLKTGVNLWGEYTTSKGPRFSQYRGVLIESLIFPNTVSPRDETGKYNNLDLLGSAQYNPMGHIWEQDKDDYSYRSRLQGYVDLKLLPGLSLRINQSFNFGSSLYRSTFNEDSYETWAGTSLTSARAQNSQSYSWINSNILSYIKEINRNHRLNATFVFEQSRSDDFVNTSSATGLASIAIGADNTSLGKVTGGESSRIKTAMMSALARVNYVFMNRYMLTASYRWDGSSRLAYNKRWDSFPSLALAWDIKQENFMEGLPFDQLKVRLGYGQTGNQAVAAYSAFNEYTASRNADNDLVISLKRIGNPDLGWERTEQYNVGLDFGFFNNRLAFNVDLYHKLSKDVLININVPLHTGQETKLANIARILNKGIEVTVNATPVANKNVMWNSVLTLSHNQGTFEKFSDGTDMITPSGGYENDYFRYIKGKRVGTIWGYFYDGIWKTAEVFELPESENRPEAGSYKFKNLDDNSSITVDDQGIIGNGQPKFNWGWSNTVNWKNFDFNLFVIGYHGFDIYNYTRQARTIGLTPNPEMNNRWRPDDESGYLEGFIKTPTGGRISSLFVEKGGFVKVKSITVGYTLPQKALQKLRVSSLRCYVSVQNPFMFTGYSGIDPEVTLKTPLASGIDWGYYPNGRNYMLGLNFSF